MIAGTGSHAAEGTRSIAVVGLACRYPDADDADALLDLVSTGRRAFRRIPPCRIDLADYYSANPGTPDATYSTRAALIEGWRFDRASFGISASAYQSADPAHWLALETACRALEAAGFAGGDGLARDTAGVFIGSTLASDVSRAKALRLRWPYSRRVLADAMYAAGVPADLARRALRVAAERYLSPFPQVTAETLTGAMPGTIATAICGHLGLRGGGRTVDAGSASSLAAVASACLALASGELDAAVAGGVDLNLDPLDLVGMAKSGVLATGDMRVYDANPTGFLPGEGCGMVLLMRTSDAKSAGLPIYAEILGWGIASAGYPSAGDQDEACWPAPPDRYHRVAAVAASQLLAMQQAYRMARVDPVDVHLIEGSGTGVATCDEAELTALAALRAASPHQVAALGSICANIGNARAAAGAAGLLKVVLSLANGVLPPSTGIVTPHPILAEGRAALSLPAAPQAWPEGPRHAAVGVLGADGLNVHLVLRGPADRRTAGKLASAHPPRGVLTSGFLASGLRRALSRGDTYRARPEVQSDSPEIRSVADRPTGTYVLGAEHPAAYLFQAPDRATLAAILSRMAEVAPWLSDAQMQDLAAQLARDAMADGNSTVRVAVVASRQEQLARLASEAVTLLPQLTGGLLTTRPAIFAADGADGRVTLLLADSSGACVGLPQRELGRSLAVLRWLEDLGVHATTAVGHGVGELAGLIWAGCLAPADAQALIDVRAATISASADAAPGRLSRALGEFAAREFLSPQRRLISACVGCELASAGEIPELLSAELFEARLTSDGRRDEVGSRLGDAVRAGAVGASLLLLIGQDLELALAAATIGTVPAVGIVSGDSQSAAGAAAALFTVGALTRPDALYGGRPSRPIDIWQEQIFITNPCEVPPAQADADAATEPASRPGHPADADADRQEPAGSGSGPPLPGSRGPDRPVAPLVGVGPWARGFVRQSTRPRRPVPAGDDQPWVLHTGGCEPLRVVVDELFPTDPAADRTLAVLGGFDDDQTISAAVRAAQDAISSRQLVVISPGMALTGLWASLHAEHPSIGITVLRAAMTRAGIAAARRFAGTMPGELLEFDVGEDGSVREPATVKVQHAGDFPLSESDVALISRGVGAAGLVLAQVLTRSGAAVAIVGHDHLEHDQEFIAELERLRRAGSRLGYEVVDTSSHAAMVAAVRRIEGRLGPVTAVAHATTATPSRTVADLTARDVARALTAQTAVLDQMVAAVLACGAGGPDGPDGPDGTDGAGGTDGASGAGSPVRGAQGGRPPRQAPLRLIATFGSVVGRYGLAGEGALALVTGALAERGERLAAASPGCRAVHVDWPGWAGAGLGERLGLGENTERAGFAVMSVAEGSRLLLKALSTSGLPGRLATNGRAGIPAPRATAIGAAEGTDQRARRFTEHVIAHYPGTELITQAILSLRSDPYLADYRIDGVPVLPPAMALEAMAQAASALAGHPVRAATEIVMGAPVVVGGLSESSTAVRICALRQADTIKVVIRSDSSGLAAPHYRATFTSQAALRGKAQASTGRPGTAAKPAAPTGMALDACELYGSICFQAGRFRRLATLVIASSRSVTAFTGGSDELPWFGADPGRADADRHDLLLGSPGLSDATLQVIQACVPHRRLLPAGCESASFSGLPAEGTVTIRATEVEQGTGQVESIWDVDAVDSTGQSLMCWRRLRMRDAGQLPPHPDPWPIGLLACYLERAATDLGLGPGLAIRISRRERVEPPVRAVPVADKPERGRWTRAQGPDDVAGFVLRVRAGRSAACAWRLVMPVEDGDRASSEPGQAPAGNDWMTLITDAVRAQPGLAVADLAADHGTSEVAAATALIAHAEAIAACLRSPCPPSDVTVGIRHIAGANWLIVQTGQAAIASVIVTLAGADQPVAIAIRTGQAARRSRQKV